MVVRVSALEVDHSWTAAACVSLYGLYCNRQIRVMPWQLVLCFDVFYFQRHNITKLELNRSAHSFVQCHCNILGNQKSSKQ